MGTMNKLTKIVLSFLMVITCINFSTVQAEDGEEVNYSEPTTVETVSEDPANEVEQEVAQEEPAVEEEATVEEAPAEQPAEEAAPVEEPQQEEVAPEASEEAQQEETTATPEETQEEAKEEPAEVQKATVEISYVDEEDKEIADKVSDKEFDVDFVVTADDKEVYKDIDGYTFKEAIVNDDAENRTFTADTIKLDGLKVTSDMNKVKLVYSKNPVAVKKDTTAKKASKKSSGLLGALENAVDTLTGKTEETSDDADPLSVVSTNETISLTVGDEKTIEGSYSYWGNKWKSSETGVVEVTGNGNNATLKAVTAGSAIITHTYYGYNGNSSETWNVTVTRDKEITSVAISGDDSVTVFKNINLTASIEPADVKNVTYTWESSNDSILIVDSNGVVTGQNPGTATVTVYASNSETTGVSAKKQITVNAANAATTSTKQADFYYLKTPTSNPDSNNSDQWGATLGKGKITLEGATWDGINTFNNVASRVIEWPDGSTGSSYVVSKDTQPTHWKAIYDKFKSEVGNVKEDEIESIILHPYKISNNETFHVDCTVEIKAKDKYTATYYVWEPTGTGYKWQEAAIKHANETTSPTKTYDKTKTVGGVTYTFNGWYTNDGLTGERVTFPYTITTNNVNFYAKYVAGYNVEYNLNGGTGTVPNTKYYEVGKTVYVADGSSFTKAGYKFAGWADENGDFYASNSTFVMPEKNVTLTAQWTSTAFKVDDLNDVIYSGDSQQLEPVVKDANDNKITLIKGTDYTVSYSEDTTNVGTVTVTITGMGNYIGEVKKTYQITPFPLVVTADSKTKGFGEKDPEFTATEASGVEGKEKPDAQEIKYSLSRVQGEDVGNYTITPSGEASQGNYTVTYKTGTLAITAAARPADRQLGVTSYKGEYDANEHTITVNNVLAGDVVEYSYDGGTTWVKDLNQYKNVGNTTIKVRVTNANYDPNPVELEGTVTITPKAVTVTADSKTKVYGTADPELTATETSGVEGKEKPDDQKIKYGLSRKTGEDVGNYTITASGEASQGNYTVTYETGTLAITAAARPADRQLGVTSYKGEYDANEHTITVNNVLAGDVVEYSYDGGTTWVKDLNQYKNVGNTTIKVRVTNANYDPNPVELEGTVTITPKAVTVTADSKTKVYGTADPELTAKAEGTLGNDTVDYELNRKSGEDVGNYTITPSGEASQGNYTVTYKTGTLTITASDRNKAVEVTSYNEVYDAKNHTIEVKNLVAGDVVKYSYDGGTTWEDTLKQYKNVGSTSIQVKVTNENYQEVPQLSGTVTITPKTVTVKADNTSKVYGAQDPSFTATVTGTLEKDKVDYGFTRESGEDVGDYTITPNGEASQGNYTVTYETGKLTITAAARPADRQLGVTSYKGEYDANEHTITVNNVLAGDVVEYSYDGGTTWVKDLNQYKNVGNTTIKVRVTNANYDPNPVELEGTVTITPKAVTVTADSKTKVYGTADPELTAKAEGTLGNDTVDYELNRKSGEDVGNYTITPSGEASQGNYTVTYKTGTLAITQSNELSIEVNAESADKSKVYDGKALAVEAEADPSEGSTVEYSIDGGKTWTTEIPSITNVGTVHVKARATNKNYSNTPEVAYDLTVTARPVTFTSATDSKPYDGTPLTNENVSVSGDGFAEGEGATFAVTGTITNVGTKANTFGYALNKNTLASNYNISTELGTLTITPKSITPDQPGTPEEEKTGITAENPDDVKYDGKDHAEKPVIKDEKTGVTLEEGKDYEIVYPEDIKNAGEITATVVGKGDYDGSFEIKFNILKRDVTFTSATDSKQYDGNALTNGNVEITGDGFIEGEGATFNVTGSITDVGSTNNAFTYAMNEGTNADNYNVTVVEGTLTVSEQPVVPTPVTPTTPSNNTPARTNNVPARVVTNPTTTTPAPEATVEPEKAETTPAPTAKPEKIKEEATPQAAPKGHWALINLIAAMLSFVLAVVALLAKHAKDEDEDDEDKDDQVVANENEDDDENESTRHRRWKVIATIDAILAVVVFILTENISLPMVLVDKWTLLMVLFGLISIVSTYFARKWHEEDEDEDEESSQNA